MREAELYQSLRDLGIGWQALEHAPVFTVEESAPVHAAMPGAHTKNLFLKDAAGQFWLATVRDDRRVDLKALAATLGVKKFSFGNAPDMEALLGVSPGSVTPLAAFNDAQGKVRVVIDESVAGAAQVTCIPCATPPPSALLARICCALAAWGTRRRIVPIGNGHERFGL
jgi:Ala-tRNA(Pro) deacylase